jgi:hypothetical protein
VVRGELKRTQRVECIVVALLIADVARVDIRSIHLVLEKYTKRSVKKFA